MPSYVSVSDNYAVIDVGGVQHLVEEGRWYTCNRLNVRSCPCVCVPWTQFRHDFVAIRAAGLLGSRLLGGLVCLTCLVSPGADPRTWHGS